MNVIQKYMCCINNDGHNEIEKVTKEISVSTEKQQNVSTIEVATMTRTTPTNANANAKDDTTNVYDNKTEEDDDFNVVTNEDYGDIQPEDSNHTPKHNNKIIFASSSSIHEYFANK